MKKCFVFMMVLTAVFCLYTAAAAGTTVTYELDVEYDYEAAEKLLEIMNSYRESGDAWVLDSQGNKVQLGVLPAVVLDETLTDAAMQRASELVISFSHTRPDGSLCFTVNNAVMAENVGVYYSTPEDMFTAFAEEYGSYANQGHRRNMLDSGYAYVGIGAVRYGGKWYWSMDFSRKAPETGKTTERRTNDTPAVIEVNPETAGLKQSVTTSVSYVQVHEGETKGLPVVYLVLGSARVGEAEDVVWTAADPSVAAVSGKQVTGLKEGNTTIYYTANGVKRSVTLAVLPAPAEPTATPEPEATPVPKATATPGPAATPAPKPTATPEPAATPVPKPTATPASKPTATQEPAAAPTAVPTAAPTAVPTAAPPAEPTAVPAPTAACDHSRYTTETIDAATCVSVGRVRCTCEDCGKVWEKWTSRDKSNHVHTGHAIGGESCGRLYDVTYCTDCGANVREELTSEGNHVWGDAKTIRPATAEQEGIASHSCIYCGTAQEYMLPRLTVCAHTNTRDVMIQEAACWQEGKYQKECADCGAVLDTWTTDKLPHEWDPEGEIVREASCTEVAIINHRCIHFDRCRTICPENTPKLPHNYVLQGNQYVCTGCGDSYPADCSHESTHDVRISGSLCDQDCVWAVICDTCGETVRTYEVPAHEHVLSDTPRYYEESTCSQHGYQAFPCLNCNAVVYYDLPRADHRYEWNEELGKKVCVVCGGEEQGE